MSISCRTPFVGIGTGRCGTNSLAKIVGACENTHTTHEMYQLYWYETNSRLGDMIRDMRERGKKGILRGEISQAVGPHVGELRSSFPDLKVVCLHRDKASTVASFMNFGSFMIRPQDKRKWVEGCMGNDARANAQRAFPLIDAVTTEQAFGFYWEMYEEIMRRIAAPVLHLDVTNLSKDEKVTELFEFLQIPADDRRYLEQRKFFTAEEVTTIRRKMNGPLCREDAKAELSDRESAGAGRA